MSVYSLIANYLRSYGIPGLITIGILLNTMSFLVLKRIKSSSTAQYMSFLGLVDTGVLLAGAFSIWLHYINLDSLPLISWLGCKLTMFLFYTLADYSVLIIVIMTAERFYGVWKPVHANKWTKKRFILIISFMFCCLLNSHFIFTHSIVEYPDSSSIHESSSSSSSSSLYLHSNKSLLNLNETLSMNTSACEFVVWKEFYEKYWIFIDATIYSFIPFVAITFFNILIIRFLNRAEKINTNLMRIRYQSNILSKPTKPTILFTNSPQNCKLHITSKYMNVSVHCVSFQYNIILNQLKSIKTLYNFVIL
jgi:hypothetical protein